jgi:protein-S-isoprenylcysteine O-methyltransferase
MSIIDLLSPQILGPLFGLSEFGLLLWKRSRGSAQSADSGSLGVLWIVILAGQGVAIAAAIFVPDANSGYLISLRPIGGALFAGGLALRWYAIFYLGRLFTVNVAIASDHALIDSGPYRYIRHPSYTGALLALLGLGICFGNWLSLIIAVLPPLMAFMRRIAIEEQALSRALGDSYVRYMPRTKRLLPFIY